MIDIIQEVSKLKQSCYTNTIKLLLSHFIWYF